TGPGASFCRRQRSALPCPRRLLPQVLRTNQGMRWTWPWMWTTTKLSHPCSQITGTSGPSLPRALWAALPEELSSGRCARPAALRLDGIFCKS
ncbi:hypothetical protein IWW45_007318, partial [Coemansia sp. RSA 485]